MRRALLLAVALGLQGCETRTTTVLLDLACGPLKLRFEERARDSISVTLWNEVLLYDRGAGWVEIDDNHYHRAGPERLPRLLGAELAFHAFPFDEKKRPADGSYYGRSRWGIFADPARVSRADHDAIAACLQSRLPDIDRALANRPGSPSLDAWPDRRPQISSMVRVAFDPEYRLCGPKTLGQRWECAGGGYVKTRIGDDEPFILCTAKPRGGGFVPNGMVVGDLSPDGRSVVLRPPDRTSDEYEKLLQGKDLRAYYATCKDGTGRGFLEAFPAEAAP
jgi:hypothetical protein